MFFSLVSALFITGCSKDEDEPMAQVSVNGTVLFEDGDDFNGDVNGDFMGNGGNTTRTFVWMNSMTTADYNADITAAQVGTFIIVVTDAEGNVVLERTLTGDSEPDSISGVTSAGISGVWSVSITLQEFSGDGSFSLSQGN